MLWEILVAIFVILLAGFVYIFVHKNPCGKGGKALPGPTPWPIVGNIFALAPKPYVPLSRWTEIYGPLFTVKFFHQTILIISDAKLAREAYNRPEFLGRPLCVPLHLFLQGDSIIPQVTTIQDGQPWVDGRKQLQHLLIGNSKRNIHSLLAEEIHDLMEWGEAHVGKALNISGKLLASNINVFWQFICADKLLQDDDSEQAFEDLIKSFFAELGNPRIMFFPTISRYFGEISGYNKFLKLAEDVHKIFTDRICSQLEPMLNTAETTDRLDGFVKQIGGLAEGESPTPKFYKKLHYLLSELVLAGSATTYHEMQWTLLYITYHKDVQKKVQEEVDQHVGRGEAVRLEHLPLLPYCQAVIREMLRKSTLGPLGFLHRVTEDTTFNGYHVPKDTWTAINQYHVHHDPEVWDDPYNFRPERFLVKDDDGGLTLKGYDELLAFSVGKRVCVGEQLAKEELCLYMTNFLHRFNLDFDPVTVKHPSLEAVTVGTRTPHCYLYVLTKRG